MGITITATHPKYSFDVGYSGFMNLRKNIASVLDEEFGQVYEQFCRLYSDDRPEVIKKLENIINTKELDNAHKEVLDFLFMSDCDGKISHKVCKQIYDLIKDVDFGDKTFRYTYYAHNDYEEFKEFLLDCYSHRKNMTWW